MYHIPIFLLAISTLVQLSQATVLGYKYEKIRSLPSVSPAITRQTSCDLEKLKKQTNNTPSTSTRIDNKKQVDILLLLKTQYYAALPGLKPPKYCFIIYYKPGDLTIKIF